MVYVLTCEVAYGQSSIVSIYEKKDSADTAMNILNGKDSDIYQVTEIFVNPL